MVELGWVSGLLGWLNGITIPLSLFGNGVWMCGRKLLAPGGSMKVCRWGWMWLWQVTVQAARDGAGGRWEAAGGCGRKARSEDLDLWAQAAGPQGRNVPRTAELLWW